MIPANAPIKSKDTKTAKLKEKKWAKRNDKKLKNSMEKNLAQLYFNLKACVIKIEINTNKTIPSMFDQRLKVLFLIFINCLIFKFNKFKAIKPNKTVTKFFKA